MEIFEKMKSNNQEQIAFYTDKSVKLRAILAIHSTALGPAIGGIRLMHYSSVDDAVFDLLRLSRAMTFKTAAAGLNFGGGEIVIIDQGMERGEALFRAIGRFIESFKGRLIAAEDIGVTEECMEYMRIETSCVTGLPAYHGGSGNHSYMCAYGTFLGIRAASQHVWGTDSLDGRKLVIQGYGRVGTYLADFARKHGADVFVSDIKEDRIEEARNHDFTVIHPKEVLREECDILAPCATGAIIHSQIIPEFRCRVIAGSANNQLFSEDDDIELKQRGILWAPDFIINSGGIIDVAEEYLGYNKGKVTRKTENIYNRTLGVLSSAAEKDISNNQAAIEFAQNRIDSIKKIRGTFAGKGTV